MSDHKVTGVFTGSYAVNPFTGEDVPIWVGEYVLSGYGTGAIMAVPAHDSRDYAFAKHFNLPIVPLIEGADVSTESFDAKEGIVMNSPRKGCSSLDGFSLNGLTVKEAIAATRKFVAEHHLGRVKVNYRLRDAIWSRQRYWGEPFPIYYKDGEPHCIPMSKLPLVLPEISDYRPTETGEPPLGRADKWAWDEKNECVTETSKIDGKTVFPIDLNTMPGFAGSSAYYLRYMDPHNDEALVGKDADRYWQNVDFYLGGSEHATHHLIYSRFWNMFLYDYGYSCKKEPFQKLVNQGMIQGRSNFVYRINSDDHSKAPVFVSCGLKDKYDTTPIHVDVNIVNADVLDTEAFKAWRPEYRNAEFILEDGKYICGWAVEKMSKSMYNVVNPDMIVEKYGADTLRLYEMFLGPIEQSKPWDTKGIDGVSRFIRKFWRLFYDRDEWLVNDEEPTPAELKVLHTLIGKEQSDIETLSYNTTISAFMIAVGELTDLGCSKRAILEPLVVLISPFCPHLAEELWHNLGHEDSVSYASFPEYNEAYTVEDNATYAVSFNGKTRFTVSLPKSLGKAEVEAKVLAMEQSAKYMAGKNVVKVIVVPGKIVNVVLK
jgi:leucyl-tRNA synthetase